MARAAWRDDEQEFLRDLADRRDWLPQAQDRFPHRSPAAIRCMMQKVRNELGGGPNRFFENAWMADAVMGSRALLQRLLETGLRPS